MQVNYLDPYKDDKYGKLRGDKREAFIRVDIEEAKVYKTDDAYILAAMVNDYKGVIRSYKPELELKKGLCAIPIYGSEYEIRRKDKDGNYVTDKIQPSIFEKALYDFIAAHESDWLKDDENLAGTLTFVPDMLVEGSNQDKLQEQIDENCQLEGIIPFGDLPEYTPPKKWNNSNGSKGFKSISPEEKLKFITDEISKLVPAEAKTSELNLVDLVRTFYEEYSDEPEIANDCLKIFTACIS